MTTQDMLKAVVERMIEGGWKYRTPDGKCKVNVLSFSINSYSRICVKTEIGQHSCFSLPDLLCNGDAMKALFGEGREQCKHKEFCTEQKAKGRDVCVNEFMKEAGCTKKVPEHYHALESVKLLLKGKPDEAVKYLFNNMRGEPCKQ